MRNSFDIFNEHLTELESTIEQQRLSNCLSRCTELTRYSAIVEYQDGVLISEVLGGVFSEISTLFESRNIPESKQKQFLTDLRAHVSSIKNTYQNDDKNSIYNALKDIRNFTTQFQLYCWNTLPAKPTPLVRRMR